MSQSVTFLTVISHQIQLHMLISFQLPREKHHRDTEIVQHTRPSLKRNHNINKTSCFLDSIVCIKGRKSAGIVSAPSQQITVNKHSFVCFDIFQVLYKFCTNLILFKILWVVSDAVFCLLKWRCSLKQRTRSQNAIFAKWNHCIYCVFVMKGHQFICTANTQKTSKNWMPPAATLSLTSTMCRYVLIKTFGTREGDRKHITSLSFVIHIHVDQFFPCSDHHLWCQLCTLSLTAPFLRTLLGGEGVMGGGGGVTGIGGCALRSEAAWSVEVSNLIRLFAHEKPPLSALNLTWSVIYFVLTVSW